MFSSVLQIPGECLQQQQQFHKNLNFGGIFFQGAPKKMGQKGQLEVQNSSADEKKGQ
jgi:cytochrome c-type biogenesis protein CcmE